MGAERRRLRERACELERAAGELAVQGHRVVIVTKYGCIGLDPGTGLVGWVSLGLEYGLECNRIEVDGAELE